MERARAATSVESKTTTITKVLPNTADQEITDSAPAEDQTSLDDSDQTVGRGSNGGLSDVAQSCVGRDRGNKMEADNEGQPLRDMLEHAISEDIVTDSCESDRPTTEADEIASKSRDLGGEDPPQQKASASQQTAEKVTSNTAVLLPQSRTDSAPAEDQTSLDDSDQTAGRGDNRGLSDVAQSRVGRDRDNKVEADNEGQPLRDMSKHAISEDIVTDSCEPDRPTTEAYEIASKSRDLGGEDPPQQKASASQQTAEKVTTNNTPVLLPQSGTGARPEKSVSKTPARKLDDEVTGDLQRRLTGTDLIMLNYRGASSSESSSEEESSSSDSLLPASGDEAESQTKSRSAVTNKQRQNRQGSLDLVGLVKTKGELLIEDLPPLDDLHIEVDEKVVLHEVGHVSAVVGVLVILKAKRDTPALDADTILFTADRKVLGQVFETFGPVSCPLYSVRFNTTQKIEERGVKTGLAVFFAPRVEEYTHYVFLEQLRRLKGSDASWEHNNEPPAQFIEYSDDEEEQRAKARQRGRDKDTAADDAGEQQQGQKSRLSNKKRRNGHQGTEGTITDQVSSKIQSWPPTAQKHRNFQGGRGWHRPMYRPPPGNPFGRMPPPPRFMRGSGHCPPGYGEPRAGPSLAPSHVHYPHKEPYYRGPAGPYRPPPPPGHYPSQATGLPSCSPQPWTPAVPPISVPPSPASQPCTAAATRTLAQAQPQASAAAFSAPLVDARYVQSDSTNMGQMVEMQGPYIAPTGQSRSVSRFQPNPQQGWVPPQ